MRDESKLITKDSDWSPEILQRFIEEIDTIAKEELQLETYPNQIEIISSEQMLDAYCVSPDHKLLRSDLKWVEAGNINIGDVVLSFDEYGPHRRFRSGTVLQHVIEPAPVYAVTLSSGKVFKVTGEHKWLVRQKKGKASTLKWVTTLNLRDNNHKYDASCIPKVLDVWEHDQSYDAGWLAGMYDGEGSILKHSVQALTIAQNEGPTLDKIKDILSNKGYTYYESEKPGTKTCKTIGITGTYSDRLKLLGSIRPERLVSKISFDQIGLMKTSNHETVISVVLLGVQDIAKITTSTGTFICDGYPMHNCSVAMPIMYPHWSFGKQFVAESYAYRKGRMGLAYEVVINSNPCIAYCMEENTAMMQALVIAHASYGHNAFFKNNYLFKQWTDAESIIDYLVFAKKYIMDCEENYGSDIVEQTLDACHALMNYGVDKYTKPERLSLSEERDRQEQRNEYVRLQANDLWRTIPNYVKESEPKPIHFSERNKKVTTLDEPQENILYFLEKNAPNLEDWQREVVRIVRKVAQYFYPQRQTQVGNEGFATWTHHTIMNRLYDKGLISEGFMLEFIQSHTAVVAQPSFDSPYYNGINPYALGFAMFKDIERISTDPTDEDKEWFAHQEWVGNGKPYDNVKWAAFNFKDESFIRQFLSPTVMRMFKMFTLYDEDGSDHYVVTSIHNLDGYRHIRETLANQYTLVMREPNIQITHVHFKGDRSLYLTHQIANDKLLDERDAMRVMYYLSSLWQFDVVMDSVSYDKDNDELASRASYAIKDGQPVIEYFMEDSK